MCGCLSLSQCEKASSCLRLGVITTRQQHVNKEDDWSVCAFVFHANQPADAAALCFVQLKQTEQHHCQHHAHSWHLSSNQYYCFLFICFCLCTKGWAETGRCPVQPRRGSATGSESQAKSFWHVSFPVFNKHLFCLRKSTNKVWRFFFHPKLFSFQS